MSSNLNVIQTDGIVGCAICNFAIQGITMASDQAHQDRAKAGYARHMATAHPELPAAEVAHRLAVADKIAGGV